MTVQEAIQQLQETSIADRIQIIELLLQSLKTDILQQEQGQPSPTPFHVHTFNLGTDVKLDREEMYADRGM